nr:hypothetical protein [Tanacetum cinerariifolium]
VMATFVISISSDSSEDSTGTPAERVILFDTIPTTILDTTPLIAPPTTDAPTIPPSPDYTPSLDYSPASEAESPVIPHRRVMILSSGQPIPHGRPYRYYLNGPIHMMTARKRVRPLPVQQFSVRHPVAHSLSDSSSRHSSSDHSSPDLPKSDPSEDPSSGHIPPLPAISPFLSSDDDTTDNHSSPDLPSTFAGPSRKRRRSPMTSMPGLPLVSRALSPVCADLIPSPKRVMDIGYLAGVEVSPRETRVKRVTHPAIPDDIPEPVQEGAAERVRDIGYLADVEDGAAEVTYETLGDLVQRFHDHTQAILVHRIQTTEDVQREQGHRIVGVESAVTALTERVVELERDNWRLRGTASVESQRVDRL